jgi:Uncharacterized protein conserved in bacteria
MRIISKKTIIDFYQKYPDAKIALEDWYRTTKRAEWENFAEIRESFNHVDSVGNQRYVFNIRGNDYRLVVVIQFTIKIVLIRFIGTHSQYDKIKDIKSI